MKLRFLLGLVAISWVGCDDGVEITGDCLTTCANSAIFTLAAPLPGEQFSITAGEAHGEILHIDCQRGTGSVACIPNAGRLVATFDVNGALQSFQVDYPVPGAMDVQVVVDGDPAAAASVQVAGVPLGGPCGTTAPACPVPQTFTLGT